MTGLFSIWPTRFRYNNQQLILDRAGLSWRTQRAKRNPILFASISTGCLADQVLQERISYLLKRPVGRPPNEVRRFYTNFTYQAGSWTKPRWVIAKVEWHSGELCPRVGFIGGRSPCTGWAATRTILNFM
jgi:hypothetical protein